MADKITGGMRKHEQLSQVDELVCTLFFCTAQLQILPCSKSTYKSVIVHIPFCVFFPILNNLSFASMQLCLKWFYNKIIHVYMLKLEKF